MHEIVSGPWLYKRDTAGRVRVWRAERQGHMHRTVSGLQDGQHVTTPWTVCERTNAGRSNERDPRLQAEFEVAALYEFNVSRDYHATLDTIDTPKFFDPMLAKSYEAFAPGFAQPKLDGVRCIARSTGLFTRQGKPITSCPHISDALKPLFEADPDLIFDGELYNHELKSDFNQIISLVRKAKPSAAQLAETAAKVEYHVYDMPSHAGTFVERFRALVPLIATARPACQIVDTKRVTTAEEYDRHHGLWMEAGYEGSMWRADAAYEQKRSKHLRKRKQFQDAEFELVRVDVGLGTWSDAAKRAVCKLPDGREFGAGIAGTKDFCKALLEQTHKSVTVKYFELTPDGIPRFPIATAFWVEQRDF